MVRTKLIACLRGAISTTNNFNFDFDLDFDFQDLARSDVKFVKVAADMLLDQLLEVDGRLALKSLKDLIQ